MFTLIVNFESVGKKYYTFIVIAFFVICLSQNHTQLHPITQLRLFAYQYLQSPCEVDLVLSDRQVQFSNGSTRMAPVIINVHFLLLFTKAHFIQTIIHCIFEFMIISVESDRPQNYLILHTIQSVRAFKCTISLLNILYLNNVYQYCTKRIKELLAC